MSNQRRPPLAEIHAERMALIKPSALGDVVHALPVLNALRHKFPAARISWVINHSYEELIAGHQALDETIPFNRGAMKAGWRTATKSSLNLARELRRRRFDLVIDLQCLARSGLMTLATRAPRRVGLSTAREGSQLAYTDIIATPNAEQLHAVERYWRVAEELGVGHLPKQFHVPVRDEAHNWALDSLDGCPRPWLAFAVGSRWLTKRWLPEHFAELARRAQGKFGGTAVFVGTPDEVELSQRVMNALHGPVRGFVGATSLQQLAALLESADVMISNDTGPLHLAAALGRPCVAPYTCTLVRRHGPYGSTGGVETDVWCKGSYIRTCDRLDCMKELTPERLWPVLSATLSQWQSHSRSA